MNNQNTTAVLSPISGQAEEQEKNSQPVPKPSPDGTLPDATKTAADGAKAATERKRTPRQSEDKRFKIFCGSANRSLTEDICKFVGVPLGESKLQRFADGESG